MIYLNIILIIFLIIIIIYIYIKFYKIEKFNNKQKGWTCTETNCEYVFGGQFESKEDCMNSCKNVINS
jgi:hypothetical protein